VRKKLGDSTLFRLPDERPCCSCAVVDAYKTAPALIILASIARPYPP
jgi:hypothetical protein